MIIADGGNLVHMLLRGKFIVQMEAEIADDRGRLDTDEQTLIVQSRLFS